MKAGYVLVRVREGKLFQNVVPDVARGAGGEGRDRAVWKSLAQMLQLTIFGTELVSPFGNAMCFVNGEESDRDSLHPRQGIGPLQPLGREIQQAECALLCLAHHAVLDFPTDGTVQDSRRDAHLR